MAALQQPEAYLTKIHDSFDAEGNLTDERTEKFLQDFVTTYVDWFKKNEN